jgi:Cu/Ag efflux protein CusF
LVRAVRKWETMTRRGVLWLLAPAVFCGCSSTKQPEKRYPMEGEILGLDAAAHRATIKHGKIGDWMGAMTMEYAVKPDREFAKLHIGDRIQATMVVQDPAYWVTDVHVGGNAAPAK